MYRVTLWVVLIVTGDMEHQLMSSIALVMTVPVSLGSCCELSLTKNNSTFAKGDLILCQAPLRINCPQMASRSSLS